MRSLRVTTGLFNCCMSCMGERGVPGTSTWRHAQCAVKPDHLDVEVAVADAMKPEVGEPAGLAATLGERNGRAEARLRTLRQCAQHGRAEDAGGDGEHADAELRELARRRHGERCNAALGGGIGRLPDLTLEG